MFIYPKPVMTITQLKQKLLSAGVVISDHAEADKALSTIGYYRLRGYCYHLYDRTTQQYVPGTNFSDILKLYNFDTELSHLIMGFSTQIEVALRARLVDALVIHNDALVLSDPSIFEDKAKYWQNQGSVASEISRSNDVFIQHNFDRHEGAIPVWAAVEVMSFGTLSKVIKNLKSVRGGSLAILAQQYSFANRNGARTVPNSGMLTSWIQSVSTIRNICAHNSRIYNRSVNTRPQLLRADVPNPPPRYMGLYEIMLAMKYLRPSNDQWNRFLGDFNALLQKYTGVYDLRRLNFPTDWAAHFQV